MRKFLIKIIDVIVVLGLIAIVYYDYKNSNKPEEVISYSMSDYPAYNGEDYIIINNNEPDFDNITNTTSFEEYGELDSLGRCTYAYANIGVDLMPNGPRENISMIKPSGWKISKYDFIEGEYLFNRCHLIAYQLTGENLNERNLITCTRHLNSVSMLEFEEKVGNYIRKTKNHVLYRSTPIFEGDNLIATGIHLEAKSIEDNGKGIKFNVFLYNIEPRVKIDYSNGNNELFEK